MSSSAPGPSSAATSTAPAGLHADAPPWVDGLTIGGMLREIARRHPDQTAAIFAHRRWQCSYRELDRLVDDVARGLLALGIAAGDKVAIWATNWPEWVILQFATARIGSVLVTINPAYRAQELAYVLKQSDARALFLIRRFRSSDYFSLLHEAVPELAATTVTGDGRVRLEAYPELQRIVAIGEPPGIGMLGWDQVIESGKSVRDEDLARREAALRPGDAINIQYTSGTTGFPKGATLTHRNLLLNAWYIGACQRLTEQDRICVPVPFYHCFGCVLGVLGAAVRGAAIVVPAEYYQPEPTLRAIHEHRCTSLYGVPTMFIAELEDPSFKQWDLSSLRTGIMAGSPCPIEIMQRVVHDMGAAEVTIAYGLTEASPVITQTRYDDPIQLRVSTVGRPLPGLEVKVVDPATGATLGDNQHGELCVRGHGVMLGYYKNPDATAAAIDADGWLHSGDLSLRQPDGYYRITGRLKEMVIRGGENIYPREIEEFLYTHPAVQDVAVVGIPDEKYGEELAAWIRLRPGTSATEAEIRDFCKGKVAHFKVPRYIRFVTEFPQTVTGKIQKFRIREKMVEELGLEKVAKRETA